MVSHPLLLEAVHCSEGSSVFTETVPELFPLLIFTDAGLTLRIPPNCVRNSVGEVPLEGAMVMVDVRDVAAGLPATE
jgi:hypothetical protein